MCPKRSHSEGTSSGHGGHGACADLSTELSADSPTVVGELCELSSNAQQNSLRRREASSNSLLEDERRILEHAPADRIADTIASDTFGQPHHHCAGAEVVGLLSAKDLILIDPEDALSVETLLTHWYARCPALFATADAHGRACLPLSRSGRDVMRVCDHTPVNKLFKDFTRGSSHLAFVARKVAPPPVDATGRDNDPSEGVARTSSGSSDADTEFIGIVTLEDVRNQPSPPLISRFW